MHSRYHIAPGVLLTCVTLLQGCSNAQENGTPDEGWFETSAVTPATGYAEYKKAASQAANGSGYVVETDMFFPTEEGLREYYDELNLNPTKKSIINKTAAGTRDLRPNPMDIRYCFCDGWGTNQGAYTAPALDGVRTAIQQAMSAWEGVARIRFNYVSSLDGTKCTTSGTNPGVDFVVQHYNSPSTAIGPFPSNAWSAQQLKVPTGGISRLLAIHELGHTIGLRHEHIHSGADVRCTESGSYEELTDFDTLSCMKYSNCKSGMGINGTEISVLDGVGIRMAYGPPDWWWSVLISSTSS